MSSNGGCVRFIVRYQVRSPEFDVKYFFRSESVLYFAQDLRRLLEAPRGVELTGLDLVVDVVGVRVDDEHELVREVLPRGLRVGLAT